jgi:hypothetical protein
MHGITIIYDSWTDPMGMSIINFMVYCNGIIFFHKSGCELRIWGKYHASKTSYYHVCHVLTYCVYILC